MLELYKNIRQRRIDLGMSQDELAKRVGYKDRSMITKIEKELIDLSRTKIYKFAEVLDIAPEDLFGYDGTDRPLNDEFSDVMGIISTDEQLSQCVIKLFKLNEQDQNIVCAMVDSLYSKSLNNS